MYYSFIEKKISGQLKKAGEALKYENHDDEQKCLENTLSLIDNLPYPVNLQEKIEYLETKSRFYRELINIYISSISNLLSSKEDEESVSNLVSRLYEPIHHLAKIIGVTNADDDKYSNSPNGLENLLMVCAEKIKEISL